MSIDKYCGSPLNFALLSQRSKCAESPIYHLFPYLLFWTCMSEIRFRPYYSPNWQIRNTKSKTYAILVYKYVDMLWTYQGSKIKIHVLIFL